jgi:hypothetical protein
MQSKDPYWQRPSNKLSNELYHGKSDMEVQRNVLLHFLANCGPSETAFAWIKENFPEVFRVYDNEE